MREERPAASGDEFRAELSDARPPTGSAPAALARRSPLVPRRTPRLRAARAALTLGVIVLALVILLASVPGARDEAGALLASLGPTPAPTVAPGKDLFNLLPNPPGVEVSLDGHTLSRLPLPGDAHPLRLTPGRHTFAWRSHLLPFAPQQCAISVPAQLSDSCATVARSQMESSGLSLPGTVLAMRESTIALPQEGADLAVVIAQALYAARSSALVQPGESYFSTEVGQHGAPLVAGQPLRATLSYQFLSHSGASEPCAVQSYIVPCRFPGQDCSQLCTVPSPSLPGVDTAHEWVAAAEVSALWQYTTLDGSVVAADVPDAFGQQLVVLRIRWDGAAWQVTPVFGHTPGSAVTDDAVCDPARFWLAGTSWDFMLADPPPGEHALFASDSAPVDGCVVVLMHGGPEIFLERFGVLVTVNAAARNGTDNLALADADEQALAQRLMAQLHL